MSRQVHVIDRPLVQHELGLCQGDRGAVE